ncbi:MAG: universal stress protein, partial [Alphaproteobacteria bacterium]|nr:universal stress protein [Alphaproteobacteria bacterium]
SMRRDGHGVHIHDLDSSLCSRDGEAPMFKTILVPTDGSDHANKAVRIAGDMAGKYDAELILLHVLLRGHLNEGLQQYAEVEGLAQGPALSEAIASIPAARFPVSMIPGNGGDTTKSVLSVVAELVLRAAQDAAREHGASRLRTLIEDGDPAQRILQKAASEGADLIVIGSRGFSDLKGLIVGSVSHKVSHLAPCPVMSVR